MRRYDAVFQHIILFCHLKCKRDVSFVRVICPERLRHYVSSSSSIRGHTIGIEHIVRRRLQAVEVHILHRSGRHHRFKEFGKSLVIDVCKIFEILDIACEQFIRSLIIFESFLVSHHRNPGEVRLGCSHRECNTCGGDTGKGYLERIYEEILADFDHNVLRIPVTQQDFGLTDLARLVCLS